MDPQLGTLLLADARVPTGGHAQSGGLEPALQAGMAAEQVPDFLRGRLRTVGLVEAAAAVLSARTAREQPVNLSSVHDALLARTPAAPLRESSGMIGRGLSRIAERLWPDHPAVCALPDLGPRPQRPVVLGVLGAAMGLDDAQTARACLYEDAQTVTSAALKLLPLDPLDATRWVVEAGAVIEESVTAAVRTRSCADLPALTAPNIEQWTLRHATRARRIFVA